MYVFEGVRGYTHLVFGVQNILTLRCKKKIIIQALYLLVIVHAAMFSKFLDM